MIEVAEVEKVRAASQQSGSLQGSEPVDLSGQGTYDAFLGTAHLGILNSPTTWQLTLDFLTNPSARRSP